MKVLIYIQFPVKAWSIPEAHAALLPPAFLDVEFVHARTADEAMRDIVDVDVSFSPRLTTDMVAAARSLRWVHSSAAAVEGLLPLAELDRRHVTVTNSRGVQAVAIAEHVMGGILQLSRKFDRTFAAQRDHEWIQHELTGQPWTLAGKRMTIVGFGTIGYEVAKRAHAFGVHVTGVRRTPDAVVPSFVDVVVGPERLDETLRGCDLLVLAAPGVSSTHGMIGENELAMLNPGALLVNIARASIVDGDAMRAALRGGQLGGAVLDVFEREPLPPDDPLWTTPHVIVTPHSSGFRASHWDDVVALFADNLRRYMRGEPLLNPVDLHAGY